MDEAMGVVAGPTARGHTVELLYIDDCPHYRPLVQRLRVLMAAAGADDVIRLRRIDSHRAAVRARFLGSPTVRVDGYDVEPGAAERHDFGMRCRLYATPGGMSATPPDEWLVRALRSGPA